MSKIKRMFALLIFLALFFLVCAFKFLLDGSMGAALIGFGLFFIGVGSLIYTFRNLKTSLTSVKSVSTKPLYTFDTVLKSSTFVENASLELYDTYMVFSFEKKKIHIKYSDISDVYQDSKSVYFKYDVDYEMLFENVLKAKVVFGNISNVNNRKEFINE